MTFQQLFFLCWILIGVAFVIFINKKTNDVVSFVDMFFIVVGPGCWINIFLIWIFKKQYNKSPRFVTEITFLISIIIAIFLVKAVFPEIFNSR